MKKLIFCLFSLALITSCKNEVKEENYQSDPAIASHHGKDFDYKKKIAYDAFLNQMANKDSMEVTIEGYVESVCQKKGCWMNVTTENKEAPPIFVKFEDYGFFMPLDLDGKIVMKGKAYREVTSVDELRHYAEDEGLSKEEVLAITEPKEELKFMASGVLLLN